MHLKSTASFNLKHCVKTFWKLPTPCHFFSFFLHSIPKSSSWCLEGSCLKIKKKFAYFVLKIILLALSQMYLRQNEHLQHADYSGPRAQLFEALRLINFMETTYSNSEIIY